MIPYAFYDDLADDYHLLFANWSASIAYQADVLDRFIQVEAGPGLHAVIECACGIGTQAIGLALRGHHVRAIDLSPRSIERLRSEAVLLGVTIETSVADLRTLTGQILGTFDSDWTVSSSVLQGLA